MTIYQCHIIFSQRFGIRFLEFLSNLFLANKHALKHCIDKLLKCAQSQLALLLDRYKIIKFWLEIQDYLHSTYIFAAVICYTRPISHLLIEISHIHS